MTWSDYFLSIAEVVRQKSKDPNTKVGAVIVGPERQIVSTGFNGFPRQVREDIPSRWEKPIKYSYVEHAERNAIYNAARHGVALRGCTLYMVGFGPPSVPCTDCARSVIQAGIIKVVAKAIAPASDLWVANLELARSMLREANVCLVGSDVGSIAYKDRDVE